MFLLGCLAALLCSQTLWANDTLTALQAIVQGLPKSNTTFVLPYSGEIDGTLVFENFNGLTIDGNDLALTQLSSETITISIIDCCDVEIKDLTLHGDPDSWNGSRNTAMGIRMSNCGGTGHSVKNVDFYNHGCVGLEIANTPDVTIEDCLFDANDVDITTGDNYNFGIWLYNVDSDYCEIRNCTFQRIGTGIVGFNDDDHIDIHDNYFEDIRGQEGIYLAASSHVDIYDNEFYDVAYVAIKLQQNSDVTSDDSDIVISGNVCDNGSSDPNYWGRPAYCFSRQLAVAIGGTMLRLFTT